MPRETHSIALGGESIKSFSSCLHAVKAVGCGEYGGIRGYPRPPGALFDEAHLPVLRLQPNNRLLILQTSPYLSFLGRHAALQIHMIQCTIGLTGRKVQVTSHTA